MGQALCREGKMQDGAEAMAMPPGSCISLAPWNELTCFGAGSTTPT